MRMKDKVAIVTGGVGCLGGASARLMAAEGAKVVITDLIDGVAFADEVGGIFLHHDVRSKQGWADIVDRTIRQHGTIDVLVNAAGIEGNLREGSPLGSYAD